MGNGKPRRRELGTGTGNWEGNGTSGVNSMLVEQNFLFTWGMSAPRVRDYRDLHAWQKAMDLAVVCDVVCEALPTNAGHLARQIRRSANSVHANIAEGNGRFSRPEYLRHLAIANGELRELESHLHFVARRYRNIGKAEEALALATVTARLLAGLTRSLRPARRD